jgi:hypothetical protein
MKAFWIVSLIAFLVFIIIYPNRSRRSSSAVYRARFFNRQDSTFVTPALFGAATDGAHTPASAPDCGTGVADAGSAGGDGGGVSS